MAVGPDTAGEEVRAGGDVVGRAPTPRGHGRGRLEPVVGLDRGVDDAPLHEVGDVGVVVGAGEGRRGG